jgi:hypothetical protein
MNKSILSSSPLREYQPGENWRTPEHSRIRGMRKAGYSWNELVALTHLSKSTIRDIWHVYCTLN